jgi:CyaY protein
VTPGAGVDPREYLRLADECLARVARWADGFDPDELECTPSDGVLTLEFADRTRFVLNRQTAASQMWFAAGARAWHFDWDPTRRAWLDAKDGAELLQRLAETVGKQLGRAVPDP